MVILFGMGERARPVGVCSSAGKASGKDARESREEHLRMHPLPNRRGRVTVGQHRGSPHLAQFMKHLFFCPCPRRRRVDNVIDLGGSVTAAGKNHAKDGHQSNFSRFWRLCWHRRVV